MQAKRVLLTLAFGMAVIAGAQSQFAAAGAEHAEFPFQVTDYSDCTDELVLWDVIVRLVEQDKVTPSGRGLYMGNWFFSGTITGETTGYMWTVKGVSPFHETYSLNGSLTGGTILLENAFMKPVTSDTPKVRLDVKIVSRFNASGDLVVDDFKYVYHCVGK